MVVSLEIYEVLPIPTSSLSSVYISWDGKIIVAFQKYGVFRKFTLCHRAVSNTMAYHCQKNQLTPLYIIIKASSPAV